MWFGVSKERARPCQARKQTNDATGHWTLSYEWSKCTLGEMCGCRADVCAELLGFVSHSLF